MRRRRCCWALTVFAGLAAVQTTVGDERQTRELFPVRDPFDEGLLRVSDIHTIAYSLHGTRKGSRSSCCTVDPAPVVIPG